MDALVVEDDRSVQDALSKALKTAGFKVTLAGTADDALRLVKQRAFGVIVCDFALPGMDGTTLFERLQAADPANANRVVFVTGWASDAKTRRLLEHTGRPFLTKPVEINALLAVARQVAGVR
jgi:DNA-binding response OmpR family regulator